MFLAKQKTIYLDHAAGAPMDDRVLQTMLPYLKESFGNPSALYKKGLQAKSAIEQARKQVSDVLFTRPDTITFTGSATEANNMALFGIARAHSIHGKHIITTKVEHESVLEPCKQLEKEGFEVTYLNVDETGQIDLSELKDAIRPDTILVSIMHANNEVGTIYPIAEIGKYLLQYRKKENTSYPYFHTDSCQAVNYLEMSVERLHVDLLTLNASKIYGPKGVGALYIRRGVAVQPIIFGGGHEAGLRSGTEHVAAIVGLGSAIELAQATKEVEVIRMNQLHAYATQSMSSAFADSIVLNGSEDRLPNNLNISFLGYEGEQLVLYLDAKHICVSTGSACTTDTDESSHVLVAMGLSKDRVDSALRFTFGKNTKQKDIDIALQELKQILKTLK